MHVLHNVLRVKRAIDLHKRVDAHSNSVLDIFADCEGHKMVTVMSPARQCFVSC